MATRQRTVKNSANAGFLALIEKYWLVLLGLLISIPYLVRYYKNQGTIDFANNIVQGEKVLAAQNENPVSQLGEFNKVTSNVYYHNLARNIAIHLGTDIQTKDASWTSWFNPRGWTENDEKAYNQLRFITNVGQRTTVAKLYYILTRRNMLDDVKKYLDSDLLIKLPLFK